MDSNLVFECVWCEEDIDEAPLWYQDRPYHPECRTKLIEAQSREQFNRRSASG